MALSKELVEAFQALHRIKFGEDIAYDVAEQKLKQLANLVRLTSPKENSNQNG